MACGEAFSHRTQRWHRVWAINTHTFYLSLALTVVIPKKDKFGLANGAYYGLI